MRKVVGTGETILDILFLQGQPVAAVPGGSSFNSIISTGRAGVPCIFVGYTGNDAVGRQTVEFMRHNGVSTDFFEVRNDEKSALSLAFLDEHGDADYTFYKTSPRAGTQWT
ncbi:MAG: carbohydrate kinase, partial [Bacteroidaceae bacterium]|nr:carbohydrate kinase [Bacteroidaceae bacterium]